MGDRLQQFLCTRKFRWDILVHKKALRASDAHLRDVPRHILFYSEIVPVREAYLRKRQKEIENIL